VCVAVRFAGVVPAATAVRWRIVPIVGFDHLQVAGPPGCEADARRFYGGLLGLGGLRGVASSGGLAHGRQRPSTPATAASTR
jgi:hypothetical protein